MSATKIYVLKLMSGKFYVGKTQNIKARIAQHIAGKGPKWTSHYNYIDVDLVRTQKSFFDEELYVKKYMLTYGIQNVRGGSYANFTLLPRQIINLQYELDTALDRCFKCSGPLHHKECAGNLDDCRNVICHYCKKQGHHMQYCAAYHQEVAYAAAKIGDAIPDYESGCHYGCPNAGLSIRQQDCPACGTYASSN